MARHYWWKEAKIYELYVDKFAGDFNTLTKELDYFLKLGVNCLHILPHYPSPMIDDGYDVTDYHDVRAELGTLDDFKHFVHIAHERGIRVIIDWVINHTSGQHPWFAEGRLSKESAKHDFYLWSETGTGFEGATNAFPDIKESNWIYNPPTNEYYFATFYPEQSDLNWDNPQVFAEIISAMDFWCEIGVDGFRLDAVPHLIKREGTSCKGLPETHALIKKIRAHLEQRFPDVILIAEAHEDLALTKEYFGGEASGLGDECHMAYHFGLMEQMWLALAKNDTTGLSKMIEESRGIPENCQWAIFLRNHDEISLGTLSESDRASLLTFLDPSQEYVMKKAGLTSVRLANVFGGEREKIKHALALLYSSPGAPIMYYGDEIGMRNLAREGGIVDTRKYVRGAFDMKAAEIQMQDPASLFNDIAKLIRASSAEIVHTEEEGAAT